MLALRRRADTLLQQATTTNRAAADDRGSDHDDCRSEHELLICHALRAPVVRVFPGIYRHPLTVKVEFVDFGQSDQVGVAGPAGEGPDIFIGASDWIGELATNGVLEPIDLGGAAGDFTQASLDALTFDGVLYGVPHAVEAIALYFNTDLVPEAPTTFDELIAACDGLSGIDTCLGFRGRRWCRPLSQLPFLSATVATYLA